ncbi:ferredoxin [Nocardioides sp. MAH-18]|uniref:Ferredoxin n=1 Tax=Nocardioides agri TaxID=2682843 RepID=A0A6L6XUA3_9ACTN|nr:MULTISPECIES: ferredoxin [unclassified Nocardioides]MBA2956149.1 ferredoxin [Nocardioides sp. CGMCC 1.13656]MVQ50994.1 ferredoxin [Nocardioides sp. MAH-18]
MRLDVDWTRCDGHGLCALLLSENIVEDVDGYPILIGSDVAPQTLRHARRAVATCPALALRLEGDASARS